MGLEFFEGVARDLDSLTKLGKTFYNLPPVWLKLFF